jgi:hypothetical protein
LKKRNVKSQGNEVILMCVIEEFGRTLHLEIHKLQRFCLNGGDEKCVATEIWLESLKGRDHSRDLGIDGKIMKEKGLKDMDWIYVAQDRDWWQSFSYLIYCFTYKCHTCY